MLRDEIVAGLEAVKVEFHTLVGSLDSTIWDRPSRNSEWTNGEIIYHITMAMAAIPSDVRVIKWAGWFPMPSPRFFDWINVYITRWGARRYDLGTIGAKFDRDHDKLLRVIEGLGSADFQKSRRYPDVDPPLLTGDVSIETIFRYHIHHARSHFTDIKLD